jgi:hypothetical protein
MAKLDSTVLLLNLNYFYVLGKIGVYTEKLARF